MTFRMLKLDQLSASDGNPRLDLMTDDTQDLARSIQAYGVLQPLVVAPKGDGFQIIAGHRRAMAASVAGIVEVPCLVRAIKGRQEVASLVENIQRVDLTPCETGIAVHAALTGTKPVKQKVLAEQLGRSEPWVSKFGTIGRAAGKSADNLQLLSEQKNADIAYEMALQMLGKKIVSPPKPSASTTPTAPATLEQLIELRALEAHVTVEYKIRQRGDLTTIELELQSEAAARLYFK